MDKSGEIESERSESGHSVFHAICEKAHSDKHLVFVAKDKADAETKLGKCREFAHSAYRIYSAQELKTMPGMTLYLYEYVNGSRSEKSISILAQSIEEAREKLAQRVGTKITILRAKTKKIC